MKSIETAVRNISQIIQDSLCDSISYDAYNELVHQLVEDEKNNW